MFLKRITAAIVQILCCAVLLLTITTCGQSSKTAKADILTQKTIDKRRIPVTVLVKHAFSINEFEKIVEKEFPEIDIIQVGNYTRDRGLVEYERRLQHDDLTDIVMTWPLDVGKQYWEDRLIDLSGFPFTSAYHLSMLNTISSNGKLYYLPGPAQVRGIVYNKTLFEEKGWNVPTNFDDFIALCQKIEKSGMRSIQLGFGNSEVLDTAFVGFSYGQCFSKPKDAQWLVDYNAGKGSFGDQFGPALDTFQTLIDAGVWKENDLNLTYSEREIMFFTRKCAMIEDSVLTARMGHGFTGTTDEFAIMPFFNPGTDNEWVRLYMVCYIGLNKHLTEPQNKKKYELILKLMKYISTPEGQAALTADTGAMFSSVKNVPPPNIIEIEKLVPVLNRGQYAIFPELKNAQEALRFGLAGMLKGTLVRSEVIRIIDEQNRNPAPHTGDREIGLASDDFTLIETGNFITDAMREKAGTDIALFLDNGKDGKFSSMGLSGRIYRGKQTRADVFRILPALKYGKKGVLQKITMTGEDLIKTLEYAIPIDNNVTGWFYYFSGLRLKFAPAAEMGSRVKKSTDSKGNAIEAKKKYTIAVMDNTVPAEFVKSLEDTDILISDILIDSIRKVTAISPSEDGRFTVVY